MKKTAAFLLAVAILACVGFAVASPGGQDDPLISKDYTENVYIPEMTEKSGETIEERFENLYIEAAKKLNGGSVSGFTYAEGFEAVSIPKGKNLCVTPGGSVLLTSGSLLMHLSGGKAIDVTAGTELTADTSAVRGHRYTSDTDTIVSYEAKSAAKAMVRGFYTLSDTVMTMPEEPDTPDDPVQIFRDVPVDSPYFEAITYCYENKIIRGVSEDEFDADGLIMRCDFACLLHRMNGEPKPQGEFPFTDVVSRDLYYYDGVVWCYENGIVAGHGDGTFAPRDDINREQMMQLMYNYVRYIHRETVNPEPDRINTFADADKVSAWAWEAAKWAIGAGIVNGTDGILCPQGVASRCEAAQTIYNLMKYLEN